MLARLSRPERGSRTHPSGAGDSSDHRASVKFVWVKFVWVKFVSVKFAWVRSAPVAAHWQAAYGRSREVRNGRCGNRRRVDYGMFWR